MLKINDVLEYDFERGQWLDDCNSLVCFGGGKGGSSAPQPIYTAPPSAPAATEEATLEEAITPEDEEKMKKEAQTKGAKSLQIPLTTGGVSESTVGGV